VLTDLKALIDTAEAQEKRGHYSALVLDSIWLRRCVYFVTLGLALVALAFPAVYVLMDWGDKTEKINQIAGGTVTYLLNLFKGFIPSFASPWVDAVTASSQLAVNIVLLFIISLVVNRFLQRRIQDRARAAWNVQPKVGDKEIDRLRLAGQRHALATAAVVLAIVAYFSYGNWKSFWAAVIGAVLSALIVFFRRKEPKKVDPANPPAALWIARKLRNGADRRHHAGLDRRTLLLCQRCYPVLGQSRPSQILQEQQRQSKDHRDTDCRAGHGRFQFRRGRPTAATQLKGTSTIGLDEVNQKRPSRRRLPDCG